MTKSPVSTCGVKVALFFPRRTVAMRLARRPRGLPSASITHQVRAACASRGFAEKDFGWGFIEVLPAEKGRNLYKPLATLSSRRTVHCPEVATFGLAGG